MKKYISLLFLAVAFVFTACDDDTEPGGTAVEKMAGTWWVTVDAVNENGNIVIEDPFGLGHIQTTTYNTAANTATEMWVDDAKAFWGYKIKASVNYTARTFTAAGIASAYDSNSLVTIENGKILEKAALTPSKQPADSIVYYISFSDDTNPAKHNYKNYKVSGFRRTGFPADDF